MLVEDGRRRVVIEGVSPEIDGGRFPAKRIVNEPLVIGADIFADGHDVISAVMRWRKSGDTNWHEVPMTPLPNDRWEAIFEPKSLGIYLFTVAAWIDHFKSWRRDLEKRVAAGQELGVEFLVGANFIEAVLVGAPAPDRAELEKFIAILRSDADADTRVEAGLDEELAAIMRRNSDRNLATEYGREVPIVVERERARYSTWYEFFPRSTSDVTGKHGSLADAERRLPYVAEMGFDVLYLPPIHPIGEKFRKGKNNAVTAQAGEPGSPWAIGGAAGGHKAVHPELGTTDDLRRFVERARQSGIEVALDIALQASPDHPLVREHPEWFLQRPDGTVQYAENPPKKYQDIYPFHFETDHWRELWEELSSIFFHWIDCGVKVFRVDNPHTKPLPFWEWTIAKVKEKHPDVIFLSEAFTRPKIMYYLAKAGFTQSYTYFTWRNTKQELTEYFTELTQTEVKDYFRPNAWPNTPDILPEMLQHGGRPAFALRVVLAATLAASYGIYGPAYELAVAAPRAPGTEEYLDSEKYELKQWNLEHPDTLRDFIARLNRIRKENPALQWNDTLQFHEISNDQMICYSKQSADGSNTILVVVNLDPYNPQTGTLKLPLWKLGVEADRSYQVHDLLSGARFSWQGETQTVSLSPYSSPARIFRIRKRIRTESDFEYFL